ncbi:MAG: heme o synthase [Saprospiraceae bacterium]
MANSEIKEGMAGVSATVKPASRLRDLAQLTKLRLSATVVLSSLLAYLIAQTATVNWYPLLILTLGGLFTTAAANSLNEVLEKDYDRQMKRTADRPLATGRMSTAEAVLLAGLWALIGISLLALFNPWTAFLGTFSLVSYAFVYTPLKRVHHSAVWVGAIPGALPVLIGCAAAEGGITDLGLTLFAIQFFWQLPHFQAIGFLGFEDYRRAGFRIVPQDANGELRTRDLALSAVGAAALLLPLSFGPWWLGHTGLMSAGCVGIVSLVFLLFSIRFLRRTERGTALAVMFFSFAYIPLTFTLFWFDQL